MAIAGIGAWKRTAFHATVQTKFFVQATTVGGATVWTKVRNTREVQTQTYECRCPDGEAVPASPVNPGNLPTTGSTIWRCESRDMSEPYGEPLACTYTEIWTSTTAWVADT